MPRVSVDLMCRETAANDSFYEDLVRDFHAATRKRHPKFPLVKMDEFGVALADLPKSFDEYFMMIEASARRNFKKAKRKGYKFKRIDYNAFLDDVREIWQSTDVRQGRMPEKFLKGEVSPSSNPPSRTNTHDYPYFGVVLGDKLVSYAGCVVSGEICMIEQLYGHADHHAEGVVPMLIIGIAGYVIDNFPCVKYYGYENFLGAGRNLRRFKKKFKFLPYHVKWVLG